MMQGYKVRQVTSKEDLVEAGYDDLLDEFSFEELNGLYVDEHGQMVDFTPTGETVEIEFAVIVHGRLCPSKVKAYRGTDGYLYITEEDFDALF